MWLVATALDTRLWDTPHSLLAAQFPGGRAWWMVGRAAERTQVFAPAQPWDPPEPPQIDHPEGSCWVSSVGGSTEPTLSSASLEHVILLLLPALQLEQTTLREGLHRWLIWAVLRETTVFLKVAD